MPLTAKQKGCTVEQFVCRYLQKQGLNSIEANYRCRVGEIDLIMQDKDVLVFVEVRYRHDTCFGNPLETITFNKQKKIIKTAYYYLSKFCSIDAPCRFDVVAVVGNLQQPRVEWIKDAFGE